MTSERVIRLRLKSTGIPAADSGDPVDRTVRINDKSATDRGEIPAFMQASTKVAAGPEYRDSDLRGQSPQRGQVRICRTAVVEHYGGSARQRRGEPVPHHPNRRS